MEKEKAIEEKKFYQEYAVEKLPEMNLLELERLSGLAKFTATAPQGKIIIIPKALRYGQQIEWEPRVHKLGVIGPLNLSLESVVSIGAPTDWFSKAKQAIEILQKRYPVLLPEFVKIEALLPAPEEEIKPEEEKKKGKKK